MPPSPAPRLARAPSQIDEAPFTSCIRREGGFVAYRREPDDRIGSGRIEEVEHHALDLDAAQQASRRRCGDGCHPEIGC